MIFLHGNSTIEPGKYKMDWIVITKRIQADNWDENPKTTETWLAASLNSSGSK